tara:strand:+ start:87 stop:449 length:363 start_codon:yes stop_codon:yes gene_type:complete
MCIAQTDSLELYKKGYAISKKLNVEYKFKLGVAEGIVYEQDLQIKDLQDISKTHEYILYNDSIQLDIQSQQIKLLNDNIDIYQKEFTRRNKFWNKPLFGTILGVIGTISIIHVVDYSLPQ